MKNELQNGVHLSVRFVKYELGIYKELMDIY